jgi:ElaB/YqjD/DUF883 family membrane-anchored ribosome-binding protein
MARHQTIRAELDQLRAELAALRKAKAPPPETEPEAGQSTEAPLSLEQQIRHLTKLADEMLSDAEDTVVEHPVASVAGALALGIVIGRLIAR